MAASTVDIPSIVLSGGPMLDGYFEGELVGSGMAIWKSRKRLAAGEIDEEQFFETALASAPSAGHCNTMGTASTRSEEHTSELQSRQYLVCRLLLEKKK